MSSLQAQSYEGKYGIETTDTVDEDCFGTTRKCNLITPKDYFTLDELSVKFKMWTLMGEPVIDSIAKYTINRNIYGFVTIDGKDYKMSDFPKEVIDKLRVTKLKVQIPFSAHSEIQMLHVNADAGAMGKPGEWSYNTPESSNWDDWIKGAYEKPLNKKDAIEAFKTFRRIEDDGYKKIHENVVIHYDVSAARNYLKKKKSDSTYPLTVELKDENGNSITGAKIYVLNIKPKYTPGMMLKKGTYKIKVVKKGFKTVVKNVALGKDPKLKQLTFALTTSAPKEIVIKDKYGNIYKTVKSPYTGKIWLDRNIGASRVCESFDDESCYGDYFNFDKAQDSCPQGYRVPTIEELKNETVDGGGVTNRATAFQSFLKLPAAGYRDSNVGSLSDQGSSGYVWSSTASGSDSLYLGFYSSKAYTSDSTRADGQSVRCLKD